MKRNLVIILVLFLPLLTFAQFRSQVKSPPLKDVLRFAGSKAGRGFSILGLDPSRLRMQQSYQMSYMSLGGQGFTQGLYLNTLTYQFSAPLKMAIQWGIAQPLGGTGNAPFMQSGPFISAAQLQYQPKKNLLLEINFRNNPYYPYGLRDRWGEW